MLAENQRTYADRVLAVEHLVATWTGVDFKWGEADCAKLATANIRALGNKVNGLLKAGNYHSDIGSRRAVRQAGFKTFLEAIDAQPALTRIAPAAVIPGDIVGLLLDPEQQDWPRLTIALGNGRVFGFYDDEHGTVKCTIIQPKRIDMALAWRVEAWPL